MDLFSRHDLNILIAQPRSSCVSLYLPTHPAGAEGQQDPIALANLLHRAEAELVRRGLRRSDAVDILQPARVLVEDEGFWQYRGDGLAVFLRAGWSRSYRVPLSFGELVVVSERFQVFPLLPLLAEDTGFLVLTLSENEARLLSGTRYGLRTVPVPDLPHGVKDALRYDELVKQRGHRFGERIGAKVRTVMHAQGVGAEVRKERLGRYLHAVDHAVHAILRQQNAPLVLAGVDHIRAAYRDITDYPHVLDAGIPGNPDRIPATELHARAWELAAPVFARSRNDAVAACAEALGTGLASDDAVEVVAAAKVGRVHTLFVPTTLPEQDQASIESAVVHTVLASGTVYPLPRSDVPGRGPTAALFRY